MHIVHNNPEKPIYSKASFSSPHLDNSTHSFFTGEDGLPAERGGTPPPSIYNHPHIEVRKVTPFHTILLFIETASESA